MGFCFKYSHYLYNTVLRVSLFILMDYKQDQAVKMLNMMLDGMVKSKDYTWIFSKIKVKNFGMESIATPAFYLNTTNE
jgi:hypothetical protein